jgi:hypothetical protein
MGEAEPMGAEVRHLGGVREAVLHALCIVVAEFLGDVAGAEIRRVSDDGIGLGPLGEEGVGAEDVFVEVVEREWVFEDEEAFDVRSLAASRTSCSLASMRVTLASSTAKGWMSMPKN